MRIALTGTPGTGKTQVAELLAKRLGLRLIKLNEFALGKGWVLGRDSDRDSAIIDIQKVKEFEWPDDCVIEGHFAHDVPADFTVVLRTEPTELKKRLEKKGWPESKVQENLEAEAMGIIADEAGENAVEIDTTGKSPEEVAERIVSVLSGKAKPDRCDFTDYL